MENSNKTFLKVVKIEAETENEERILKRPNVRIELQSRAKALLQEDVYLVGEYLLTIDRKWELSEDVKLIDNITPYIRNHYENADDIQIGWFSSRSNNSATVTKRRRYSGNRITLVGFLGEGRFGEVFKAEARGIVHPDQDETVAVKMLKLGPTDREITGFLSEIHMMKSLEHKNIIKLLRVAHRYGELYAILEYASHGSLKVYIEREYSTKNEEYFAEHGGSVLKKMKSISIDVARGMNYLKRRSFVHRDLAARNVLIFEGPTAKIADFGLSRKFDKRGHDNGIQNDSGPLPIIRMAPESLKNNVFTTKSDVWSFGVLLWEIMSLGKVPCLFGVSDRKELESGLRAGRRLECPTGCPEQIYALMLRCWAHDPGLRPTFIKISRRLNRLIWPEVWQPRLEISNNFDGYDRS